MSIPESIGTLNLKIARLGRRLCTLEQRKLLSQTYPNYHTNLARECSQLRLQLEYLSQQRQKLLQNEYTGQ